METKLCPYCGGEIMKAAKKCKHCGEWLEKQNFSKNPIQVAPTTVSDEESAEMKKSISKKFYLIILAFVIFIVTCWLILIPNESYYSTALGGYNTVQPSVIEEPIVIEQTEYYPENNNTSSYERYKAKYDEVHIADIHVMRADGKKIWYTPWTSEIESGYGNKLFVYDSETDYERVVNLNKTSLDDNEMFVKDMVEHNGVITIIMTERRNSNGWLDGTYVWQYNCDSDTWRPIAKACSGAEFTSDRDCVEIDYADCLNPGEPTFMQEYQHNYRIIRL